MPIPSAGRRHLTFAVTSVVMSIAGGVVALFHSWNGAAGWILLGGMILAIPSMNLWLMDMRERMDHPRSRRDP